MHWPWEEGKTHAGACLFIVVGGRFVTPKARHGLFMENILVPL